MTIKVRVRTPSRLHFTLLDMNGELGRVDGGIGVALEHPHFTITAEQSPHLRIIGHEASATEKFAKRFLSHFKLPPTVAIAVHDAIPAHVGLGSRTQLSLGIASALAKLFKINASVEQMAAVMGRGGTSGIGLAAFKEGGFILDGGHTFGPNGVKQKFLPSDACVAPPPPLLMRHQLPEEWSFVTAVPRVAARIHGEDEKRLFTQDCPVSGVAVNALCRVVLMKLLPAVVEKDVETFGQALTTIQEIGFKRLEIKRQHP
ncbi:MAG: beta-ribofuranosylaminobenzene 5'-phosphate synthase family protein, partial [Candidatus Bathyarchaeia archaeon]